MNRKVTAPVVVALAIAGAIHAQQPNEPRVGYVYPAGGQRGTTFTVSLGGRFLDGVNRVLVSGDGVSATVLGHDKPLAQRQITELREKLRELQARASDPAVRKEVADLRLRIGDSQKRNQNPSLSEIVTIEVAIAQDARPDARALRVGTARGLSNPIVFSVGELVEFREPDSRTAAVSELPITLPAVVNGRLVPGEDEPPRFAGRQGPQYAPGDSDRYRFSARKGQELVVDVRARALMPYLSDAVPGWFQAAISLFDGRGRELAYADDFHHNPDPVLHADIPADGEYVVEIRDALLRGREDFVYRISISDEPHVAYVPPAHQTAAVTRGWDALPEQVEHEPNDGPKDTQRVAFPVVVSGRIDREGDRDVFSFRGRRGESIVAEVLARRVDSPVDSILELMGPAGRRLAVNDDHPNPAWGLHTHDADSLIAATLPVDGLYTLRLGDVQRKGGREYTYRLRISAPLPDFELRVTPSAINAAGGTTVPLAVDVRRTDGFHGDIALALKDAPRGLMLSGDVVPAGQSNMKLTLTIPAGIAPGTFPIRLEGSAVIAGKTLSRPAVPADDVMQAFAYRHLVAAENLYITVTRRGRAR